ncbi:FAD-dependent monooxygenase [Streptomyces europaeiscabiei]|uniref:FAD-dependent monooxygenase n=1 Tax=Streptomyces europaeiscabiei TaxID=146819 RepID=UPI000A5F0601|nr:FAD-dependent monooxygenase [Streptomyces europaeiscabiei]
MPATVSGPRIAIVGGGIGGLAAGAFLRRAGLTVTVYEQAPALTEVGAGLVMAPNAVRLLRRLGVMDQFLRRAVPLDRGWEFRRWADGSVLSVEKLSGVCERLYGERTYVVHRADLLDSLRATVPSEWVRLGARCTAVDARKDVVSLRFADGSQAEADIVIGADGVHSVVRGAVTEAAPPTYSGICAFRTIVSAQAAPDFALRRAQTLWLGPGRHFVHYPVAGGQAVNVVAFAPAGDYTDESWSTTATIEAFRAEFADWDPRVTDLITAGGLPGRWAMLDRAPLRRWSRGRITLLGDAAHAHTPRRSRPLARPGSRAEPARVPNVTSGNGTPSHRGRMSTRPRHRRLRGTGAAAHPRRNRPEPLQEPRADRGRRHPGRTFTTVGSPRRMACEGRPRHSGTPTSRGRPVDSSGKCLQIARISRCVVRAPIGGQILTQRVVPRGKIPPPHHE